MGKVNELDLAKMRTSKDPVQRMAYWIVERENIRHKKEKNAPLPWTHDSILSRYRFCNVHREDDKVTRWISKHWRKPNAQDPNLWHAMIVARYINWPDTLELIGYPEPWPLRKQQVQELLHARKHTGEKVFTGAYLVSTNGATMDKIDHVCALFTRAWNECAMQPGLRLSVAYAALMEVNGIGSFMAAQVVADLKNTPYLRRAKDWHDWAAPGPGSLRGLSRVRGLGTASRWRQDAFIPELLTLRKELHGYIGDELFNSLCLQDLQNCLCEFDKWERTRLGQGKPRASYHPHSYTI